MTQGSPIAVLGAGSWGTALALLLARNGQPTFLWGRDVQLMEELARTRSNSRFLPGIRFPDTLQISSDLHHVFAQSPDILLAVPSHGFHDTLQLIRSHISSNACVAWATKGFDPGSGHLLHHIAAGLLGDAQPIAVISGPTFAREVASGLPTAGSG